MAEYERLKIVIDVVEKYERELNQLLVELAKVETAAEAVEDINIDVDVRGEHQLDALIAKLGVLEGMDVGGVGNIDIDTSRGGSAATRGGGGGGRMGFLLSTQVAQMGRVISQFDELGDSTSGLATAQRSAMSAADKAADSFDITNLRMSDIHNSLANILPLLVVFIGALPAVIGGLIAVGAAAISAAAALAAIGGFAALGAAMARGDGDIMEGMMDILSEIRDDFLDAFTDLAQRLEPMFEDFIDGLDRFFQRVSSLDDVLMDVTDDAQAFGSFMSDWVTGLIRDMGLMADAFAPIFSRIGGFAEDMNLLRNLGGFMADILPEMIIFTRLTIGLIVRLAEMSKGFLQVTNIIGILLSIFFKFLNAIGLSNERIGTLVAVLLTAASAAAIYGSALWSSAIPALATFGTRILAAISSLTGYSAASVVSTLATYGLAKAFLVLVSVITLGVGALAAAAGATAALGSAFGELGTDIDSATESLRAFQNQQDALGGGKNPYASPEVGPSGGTGQSRFGGGGGVTVNVEGDADAKTVQEQSQNAMYRMERPKRSR